ncbi:uncharacterized protein LOC142356266 [Convolutriloba macropyga]|uniref:uncharacterized protein LOC142356266 n=1 Tax=Convolutriloba macropyga TaxID=536237 RepID=UPI003F52590C
MTKGQTAEVKCSPKYGYGEKGSFSFPSVPPNASLTYVVELIDWEAPEEFEDPKAYMFFEDKLEASERRRLQGNELFRAADIVSAMGKYNLALSFLPEDLMFQLEGFHEEVSGTCKWYKYRYRSCLFPQTHPLKVANHTTSAHTSSSTWQEMEPRNTTPDLLLYRQNHLHKSSDSIPKALHNPRLNSVGLCSAPWS